VLKVTGYIGDAEVQLRLAVIFVMGEMLERQDSAFLDSINNAVIGRLDMEAYVSQQLREKISGRQAFP
jgi:cell division protein FtsI/penicillin-binding protein 2